LHSSKNNSKLPIARAGGAAWRGQDFSSAPPAKKVISAEKSKTKNEENHSPEVGEPFDELGGVVLVELDVWEVHLEHRRAGVAHPEEHELGFPQVHGGEG
jgi:hypothetical protein